MTRWLDHVAQLVSSKDKQTLTAILAQILTKELHLSHCVVLVPSVDCRQWLPHDQQIEGKWEMDDLNHPFSHVAHSGKTMLLSQQDRHFWTANPAFSSLISSANEEEMVGIYPLPFDANRVRFLLCVIGSVDDLTALQQPECTRFLDVFVRQWALLDEIEQDLRDRRMLSESLHDIERETKQRNLAEQLAKTLIGHSEVMKKLRQQIINAAESTLSVMVQGETGTGKELVAQAIHQYSNRAQDSMVAINCSAIPESLLESELFGYCKGAFSGADNDKKGLIAQADGGTLFLDEIGDMPLALQAKLLRVLETKRFRPIGGKKELPSDFRLVSATHVNLLAQVHKKQFRQDLYYRLLQYPLSLPRLEDRLDDLPELCAHFIELFNAQNDTHIRGLRYQALDRLKQHHFPGNIRELKHLIEFGCTQCGQQDGEISEQSIRSHIVHHHMKMHDLPTHGLPTKAAGQNAPLEALSSTLPRSSNTENVPHQGVNVESDTLFSMDLSEIDDLKQAVLMYEKQIIEARLSQFAGDRTKAAQSLGLPKRTLADKCKKLEVCE